MVSCIGHSIISPLGVGSAANVEAVRAGRSGLSVHTNRFADVEPFCASLFDTPQEFVPLCIRCVEDALNDAKIAADASTIFILSTTKGDNLDLLTPAQTIARHFGNPNPPVVVSNACTSGVCAQITAKRLLDAGLYQHAIVVGCDIQTRFIVSGFQSFKALSPEPCLPFSPERKGLNLGEAAATIIYSQEPRAESQEPHWVLEAGSIHNDANHLSAPSRTGEGAYRCLIDVLEGVTPADIDLLGVHGTATLYNDDMETIAIERARLQDVEKSILKPFFGHTMGAAGIVETIIGIEMLGKGTFIKMLSGFGGVNAAIRLTCK
ncbi:MAG: beta-ketoacyl synthase [Paludibacteraceae bacterium]|nr:beta-ketoacyl synthase [Paludibacteraceae bacterium]